MTMRVAAIADLVPSPFTDGTVRQVEVPPAARELSTLPHVDYEDAFLAETGPARNRTAEQWARTMVEDVPAMMRRALRSTWFALGLQLGSTRSAQRVLGWEMRRSTPDFALFGAESRLGLPAELVFMRRQHTLLFATLVQQENLLARAVWAGTAPGHRQVVRYLLEQAVRRAGDEPG